MISLLKRKEYDAGQIYGKDRTIIVLLAVSSCISICLFLIGKKNICNKYQK